MFGKVLDVKDNKILIEVEKPINGNYLELLNSGKENLVDIQLLDQRKMSYKQIALSYALIGDISRWSYDEPEWIKEVLKFYYKGKTGKDFSHSRATKQEGNEWLDFLIQFVIKHHIELPGRYHYLLERNAFFYYCLKYRSCCICGRHADIAHVESVGMGRNRLKINHVDFFFMALCRIHHQEQHQIGVNEFIKLYHIIPVKLTKEERKKLRIGG